MILSEIPVFPTVTAKVTFQHFSWENEMPASKFIIPKHYTEDPYHFPDLWYFLQLTFVSILTSLCCMEEDSKSDPLLSRMSTVSLDVPMTNLGSSGAQMTLLFWEVLSRYFWSLYNVGYLIAGFLPVSDKVLMTNYCRLFVAHSCLISRRTVDWVVFLDWIIK